MTKLNSVECPQYSSETEKCKLKRWACVQGCNVGDWSNLMKIKIRQRRLRFREVLLIIRRRVLIFLSPCRMHFKMWVSKLFSFFLRSRDFIFHSAPHISDQKTGRSFMSTHHSQLSPVIVDRHKKFSFRWLYHLAHVLCQPSTERNCCELEKNFSIFSAFRSRVDEKKLKAKRRSCLVGMVRQKEKKRGKRAVIVGLVVEET